ncbi:MAG: ABC transporter ATP-binding protein [Clostridia bacterium]|nr:ABC transporter ATP-binding protein [Clostridia bacterium]
MAELFECRSLCKNYGSKAALDAVNLTLGKGKIVGLLGSNGSGKTTMMKITAGLLTPTYGEVLIDGEKPGAKTKSYVSYLPDKECLYSCMTVGDLLKFYSDFYADFDREKAVKIIQSLNLNMGDKLKTLSKGTKEKVQIMLVMSRNAKLYLLDEPIGGVDPAARDYILNTIITNYNPEATVIISTHLISDIENVLDEVVFIGNGRIMLHSTVDEIREKQGKSVDEYFREVFRC